MSFKILLAGIVLLWFSYGVAQTLPSVDGAITIKNLMLEEKEGKLLLTFETEIAEKAMNYRQSWRIIPELGSPRGETRLFPSILINGKQKERHYKRKMRYKNRKLLAFEPEVRIYVPQKEIQVVMYRQEVPYEPWMEDASLTLHQLLTSAKERKQLFTNVGVARLPSDEKVVEYIHLPASAAPEPPIAPVLAIHGEAYIGFEAGKAVVIPDFMNNRSELEKIEKDLRQILENKNHTLAGILLTGYASPEGPIAINERLSEARTKALKAYISERYGITPEQIGISHVVEDWNKLRVLVEKSDLAVRGKILSILDSGESEETQEQRLRALQPAWSMLMNDFFPRLRRVDY